MLYLQTSNSFFVYKIKNTCYNIYGDRMKKYIILITTLVLLLTGCTQLKEYNKNLFFMDTYINIKVYMNNPKQAKKILDGASKIYEKYQKITNKYDLDSEVSKINANLTYQVSDELYEMLELGSTWYDKSDGLFNINMGNLIDVWKNHKENDGKLPTPEELNIEIKKIELRNKKVYSNNLDLGAIAKGFTTQKVADYFKKNNIKYYLINAGGNILAGENESRGYYKIGIEDPTDKTKVYSVVKGENISVVTSGGYERFFQVDGVNYHHIIDPFTKYPATNMLSVTIVSNDSGLADILSTTLFLMEPNKAISLIETIPNTEAIIYINKDQILKSSGYSKYE